MNWSDMGIDRMALVAAEMVAVEREGLPSYESVSRALDWMHEEGWLFKGFCPCGSPHCVGRSWQLTERGESEGIRMAVEGIQSAAEGLLGSRASAHLN